MLVEGRTVKDEWEDADDNERTTFKIEARRVGILPYRIQAVTLSARDAGTRGQYRRQRKPGDEAPPGLIPRGAAVTTVRRPPCTSYPPG